MEWISEVAKHHKLYIRYIKGMGVNTHAEDLVQEMYLRIYKYSNAEKCITNGKVNKHYIWRVLYNIRQSHNKDSQKFHMVELDNCKELASIDPDNEREEAYERIMQKLFSEMNKLDNKKRDKKGKDVYPYNQELLKLYGYTEMSYRDIASITSISLTSIFNTITNCKVYLSDELREDIEDFYNHEYELI